jgi:apolipoprotein N-acyltransferase
VGASWRQRLLPVLLALATGLLIGLLFTWFDLWPLAWCALAPLLAAVRGRGFGRTFALALLAGGVANSIGFFWMSEMLTDFGHLPMVLALAIVLAGSFYQGLAIALAFALAGWMEQRRGWRLSLVLPPLYTAIEAVHPILFPWYLGNCQYRFLPFIQVCDLAGVSALTYLLVMGNAVLFEIGVWVKTRSQRALVPWLIFAGLMVLTLVYGQLRLSAQRQIEESAEKWRLAIVEPDIGILEEQVAQFPEDTDPVDVLKWNLLGLHRDSARLAKGSPDLLVWPESAYFPALSVYARERSAEWAVATHEGAHEIPSGAEPPARVGPAVPFSAVTSVREGMTRFVGPGGRIARLRPGGLEDEESGTQADLLAIWTGCRGTEPLRDTRFERCSTWAVGRGGTMLAKTRAGWRPVDSGTTRDLTAVAGIHNGPVVAAGDGTVLAATRSGGVSSRHETEGAHWAAALGGEEKALLVSAEGTFATVDAEGRFEPQNLAGRVAGKVRAAARMDDDSLLLATDMGLSLCTGGAAGEPQGGRAFAAIACAADGRCLAADDEGRLVRVTADGAALTVEALGRDGEWAGLPGVTGIAAVPFPRHYYWIPPEAVALFRSDRPVADELLYPQAFEAEKETPEAHINAPQRGFRLPLLFGATSGVLVNPRDPQSLENTRYNSTFLLDESGEVLGRYDKQYLLAFGEYIPFGDLFPILYEWSPDSGRFRPGPRSAPLEFKGKKLGVLICYEDLIQSHTNRVASQGSNILINQTNDAWFGRTKEAMQHFVLALFRAVEQRLVLVRSTTTGISGVVSSTGEILAMTGPEGAETIEIAVPLLESRTVYQMFGRHFGRALLAVCLLLVVLAWRRTA